MRRRNHVMDPPASDGAGAGAGDACHSPVSESEEVSQFLPPSSGHSRSHSHVVDVVTAAGAGPDQSKSTSTAARSSLLQSAAGDAVPQNHVVSHPVDRPTVPPRKPAQRRTRDAVESDTRPPVPGLASPPPTAAVAFTDATPPSRGQKYSVDEDLSLFHHSLEHGFRWAYISRNLMPGRTESSLRFRWSSVVRPVITLCSMSLPNATDEDFRRALQQHRDAPGMWDTRIATMHGASPKTTEPLAPLLEPGESPLSMGSGRSGRSGRSGLSSSSGGRSQRTSRSSTLSLRRQALNAASRPAQITPQRFVELWDDLANAGWAPEPATE